MGNLTLYHTCISSFKTTVNFKSAAGVRGPMKDVHLCGALLLQHGIQHLRQFMGRLRPGEL